MNVPELAHNLDMATLPNRCPSCDSPLTIAKLRCASCETQLEGSFEISALLRLVPADFDFVLRFVKSSGSLKEMASQSGQSYPAAAPSAFQVH